MTGVQTCALPISKKQCEGCPNQGDCLNKIKIPNKKEVEKLLEKLNLSLDFFIDKEVVFIRGGITQEDRSFLRHNLRFPVKSEKIEKTLSEKIMSK